MIAHPGAVAIGIVAILVVGCTTKEVRVASDNPQELCLTVAGETPATTTCLAAGAASRCRGPIQVNVSGKVGDTGTVECGTVSASCTIVAPNTSCSAGNPGPAAKSAPFNCTASAGAASICSVVDP